MYETDISKMNFKQLREEVQELRDELSRFKRIYEDSIENLDDSNLSAHLIKEKENMKTEISVSADGVKSLVVKTDEMSEQYSTLSQTADEIKSEVSKITSDVSDFKSDITQRAESIEASVEQVNDDIGKFKTTINQTSTNITSIVQATYSNPTEVEGFDINNDEYNKVFYDTSSNLYWHYNGSQWESSSNGNFGTVFEQTGDCFKLKGNVKVSGDLVSGGVIQGSEIRANANKFDDGIVLYSDGGYMYFLQSGNPIGQWINNGIGSTAFGSYGNARFTLSFDFFRIKTESPDNSAVRDLTLSSTESGSGSFGGRFCVDLSNSAADYREVKFIGLNETDDGLPYVYANEKLLATKDYVDAYGGSGGGVAVFG